jgi:hypothetical protein
MVFLYIRISTFIFSCNFSLCPMHRIIFTSPCILMLILLLITKAFYIVLENRTYCYGNIYLKSLEKNSVLSKKTITNT